MFGLEQCLRALHSPKPSQVLDQNRRLLTLSIVVSYLEPSGLRPSSLNLRWGSVPVWWRGVRLQDRSPAGDADVVHSSWLNSRVDGHPAGVVYFTGLSWYSRWLITSVCS
jgi:hypothetical protein